MFSNYYNKMLQKLELTMQISLTITNNIKLKVRTTCGIF